MPEETHTFTIDSDALQAVQQELASRVRLRVSVKEPRWWEIFSHPVVTVTGPGAAVASAAQAIRTLERDAWGDRQW